MADLSSIGALTCDVFGTVVDWRGSIVAEGDRLNRATGLAVDWGAVADDWRAGYAPSMARVMTGDLPWLTIDELHRRILDDLVPRHGLDGLTESELADLNRVWHRLRPWPDAVAGIERLRTRFVVATLSNGNVSLLVDMAKHAGLPWDVVLSAELFGAYKPDPSVYRGAARLLGLPPERVLMVATHPSDLRAAAAAGLRTAFVHRPLEHGPAAMAEPDDLSDFDVVAGDFGDLADQLVD